MSDSLSVVTADRGLQLIRVGWLVAELRGRTRADDETDRALVTPPSKESNALPLVPERSPQERLHCTQQSLLNLGHASGLAMSSCGMADIEKDPADPADDGWARVVELSASVPRDASEAGWKRRWNGFADALFLLDARVQDALSSTAYGELSAYLLGRALSETSWALDPMASAGAFASWEHLLGEERCLTVSGMVERLTCHVVPSDIGQAIRGSLAAWHREVLTGVVRGDDSSARRLREQSELWRDLLLSGASPGEIVPPKATLMHMSSIRPVIRMLFPQLVIAFVSAVLLGLAAWLFSSNQASGGPTGAVIGVFSVLGLTGAAISAKAKSDVNDTLNKLQAALQADLIVERATILPDEAVGRRRGVKVSAPGQLAEPVQHKALSRRAMGGQRTIDESGSSHDVGESSRKVGPELAILERHVAVEQGEESARAS